MKKSPINYVKILFLIISLTSCSIFEVSKDLTLEQLVINFENAYEANSLSYPSYPGAKIESVNIDSSENTIVINFNKQFSYMPFRPENIDSLYSETERIFFPYSNNFEIKLQSMGYDIKELVPNFYQKDTSKIDHDRLPQNIKRVSQVTFNKSKDLRPIQGLFNKNIALWHSHGWYYNHERDRWLWQRARLFQTVEDIGPISFTLPYILPMLENAGANVFLPRERDTQSNEIIVDDIEGNSYFNSGNNPWMVDSSVGFRMDSSSIPANVNPFMLGSFKSIYADSNNTASVEYIPNITEKGFYSVYISYQSVENSSKSVLYKVYHTGGITDFIINQSIGGSTWIHLGQFKFDKGKNPEYGKVVVSTEGSKQGGIITTDAVKFGGGLGVVSRKGETSGRPKYTEAARYFLQYAGIPDTLVYNINDDQNDYKDDYQSRGEWVNYLKGNPSGPNKDRKVKGLGIPIDASIAFHTDAGTSQTDTTIGTLAIYTIEGMDTSSMFPENYSRLANRDFADILQSEIVNDIKAKYDPVWNRRQLMNAQYSESTRPNIPSVLLELASHQNFLDVEFMADPRFKFDVSRSIYKSVLKFLSVQYNYNYVVQPLPVTHFAIEQIGNNSIRLSWKPQVDPLEDSAFPNRYIIYKSVGTNGFDNGSIVDTTNVEIDNLEYGKTYNFKVTAVNEGGESFPSEILSCSFINNSNPTVLIVNGFDRISPPASVRTNLFTGFVNKIDEGVPYMFDIGFTGEQHDFNPYSPWKTDDIPGHGASYADHETKIVAGNTFNYPFIHGQALKENGYSFISVSDEVITDGIVNLNKYKIVDLIMGEEKTTAWTKPFTDSLLGFQYEVFNNSLLSNISDYLENDGKIFISGSYIGSDIFLNNRLNYEKSEFIKNKLKYVLASDHAVKNGNIISSSESFLPVNYSFSFVTEMNDSIYNAEAPDALDPINGSQTLLRYSENFYSAAIGFKEEYSIIAFGFPFETIRNDTDRNRIMKAILEYLN